MGNPRNSLTFKMPPQLAKPNPASGNQYWKSTPAKVMRASGASPQQIKKVEKAPKPMSAEMAAWVRANRKKLTKPTEKQEALFKQYDALKKAGNLPSTANVKSRPSPQAQPSTSTKTGGKSPVQPARQTKVQKAAEAVRQRSTPTNTRANRQPGSTGGRGGGGGSTPTKKKSKLNPQQQRKAGLTKKRGGTSLKDVIKKFDSKLRLTYKKGQLVQRGDEVYRSDGKGGLKRVYRKQF